MDEKKRAARSVHQRLLNNAFKEKLPEDERSKDLETVIKEIHRFIWPIVERIENR